MTGNIPGWSELAGQAHESMDLEVLCEIVDFIEILRREPLPIKKIEMHAELNYSLHLPAFSRIHLRLASLFMPDGIRIEPP